ncbi:hypothetical protein ACHAWO_006058 [Cyclotella atomus]|uniref:Apyrase n=1 Tax=Cyclotella atomus TaxID=382360 RepID=A0ABD3PXG7_9STRA
MLQHPLIRFIVLSVAIVTCAESSAGSGDDGCVSPFRIVIDAGSTGSRLHIFEFVTTEGSPTQIECLRRGSSKAWTPLSAFATNDQGDEALSTLNSTHVAHHMLPLFDYASIIIPQQYHACTSVAIAATAGMRLLSLSEQNLIYDALYEGLTEQQSSDHQTKDNQFVFTSFKRKDVYTLNGEREGFFGAVAANYLRGVIDAQLRVIVHDDDEEELHQITYEEIMDQTYKEKNDDKGLCTNKFGMCEEDAESVVFGPFHHYTPKKRHDVKAHGPLGALDMGGSSTQIVYRSKGSNDSNNMPTDRNDQSEAGSTDDIPSHLHHDDFYAVSYLSYGADQFRVRLWDLWVGETQQNERDADVDILVDNNVITNPCSFVGYRMEYQGYILLGTGDAVQCSKEVNRLIPYHDNTIDLDELYDENNMEQEEGDRMMPKKKLVGSIEHPPIRGKFYGMSLYFFTLDCLRELSDPDHPIRVSFLS